MQNILVYVYAKFHEIWTNIQGLMDKNGWLSSIYNNVPGQKLGHTSVKSWSFWR